MSDSNMALPADRDERHRISALTSDGGRAAGKDAIRRIMYRAYCDGFNDHPHCFGEFWAEHEAEVDAAAAALAQPVEAGEDGLRAQIEAIGSALVLLEQAASEVHRKGAVGGAQWLKLGGALVRARAWTDTMKGTQP